MQQNESAQIVVTCLFEALQSLVGGDAGPWPELFHDEGVQEFPFAPAGYRERLEGKKAIAEYMKGFPRILSLRAVHRDEVHVAQDALVVVFHVEATAVKTGLPYPQRYVGIIRHSEGKILHYCDYWNPIIAIESMGGAESLLAFFNKA